jgi:hypothetical protein
MKNSIFKLILPLLLACFGGLVTKAASANLIPASEVAEVQQAAEQIANGIAFIISGLIAVGVSALQRKFFPTSEMSNGNSSSGGNVGLLLLACTASALTLAGGLTSCGPLSGIKGSVLYRDPNTGAKGGLSFDGHGGVSGTAKIPVYDGNGRQTGWAEVEIPIKTQSVDTKSSK